VGKTLSFATQEVGKGTGQRLAISHNVVMEKHGEEKKHG
jgi:hypothetical protein